MAKVVRIHPSKTGTWGEIRQEFVEIQELVSAVPRLRYQHGTKRKRRPVRGNMLFEYRPFKRQSGRLRASQLRDYLKSCLPSAKVLTVELVWPDGQEVNGRFLVEKMRSPLRPHVGRMSASLDV
jgi:hypothetical protein